MNNLPTTTFQPNSFLSRSSPSANSAAMSSPSFIKPQQTSASNDLASSVGLRRRMNIPSSSGGSGNAAGGKRPPLPNMTRLGLATEIFDDFKENIQNGKIHETSNTSTTTTTTPSSSILKSGFGFDSLSKQAMTQMNGEKRPPQSSSTVSWKNGENEDNSNNKSHRPINYNTWVLIYGFTNNLEYDTIVANFENYGTITDRFPSTYTNGYAKNGIRSGSNWICVKYVSSLEAEKALCQNQSLVHVVGQNSFVMPSSNGTMKKKDDLNHYVFQDDIVAIGVMRLDETIAMKVGLANFLENGSTGFQTRNLTNSVDGTTSRSKGGNEKKNVRFATSIETENDILLLGNEHLKRKSRGGDDEEEDEDHDDDGGVCKQFLSWFFQW